MKILATSDWHFHPYKAFATVKDGINSRLADIRDAWTEAVDVGVERGCEVMTISGDLFHVRGQLRPSVVNLVQRCVKYAVKQGMTVIVLSGNHDMEDYKGGATAVEFLHEMQWVTTLPSSGPGVEIIKTQSGKAIKVGWIPYIHNDVEYFLRAARETVAVCKPDIVLIHQGIDNFKPTAMMPDTGVTVAELQDVFGSHVPVLCGHYHKPMQHGNIMQIGAPVQHTFNDEGQERGVAILDTEVGPAEFVKLGAPEFKTIDETTKEVDDKVNGHFVRIKWPEGKKVPERAISHIESMAAGIVVVRTKEEAKIDASRPVIEAGTVRSMLEAYVDVMPELKPNAKAILALYDEVCL